MALALPALRTLAPHLRDAQVLSLGYPDILATEEEVEEIFGVKPEHTINAGAQHHIKRPLVETVALFKLLGSTLDCVDIVRTRGVERVLDLNEPHDLGEYDLVIDPGTTEHCFNIGQAMMTAARSVRVGGHIYHSHPLSMMNHGFYNVCPTMPYDFYTQNGWKVKLMEARHWVFDMAVPIPPEAAVTRYAKAEREVSVITLAQRLTGAELRWPLQTKYLRMAQQRAAA